MNDEIIDNFLELTVDEKYILMLRWLKNHCFYGDFRRIIYKKFIDNKFYSSNGKTFEDYINDYRSLSRMLSGVFSSINNQLSLGGWYIPRMEDRTLTSDDALGILIDIQWLIFVFNNSFNCSTIRNQRFRYNMLHRIDASFMKLSYASLEDIPCDLFFDTYFYAKSFLIRNNYNYRFDRYLNI